jgi:hypothetical protein
MVENAWSAGVPVSKKLSSLSIFFDRHKFRNLESRTRPSPHSYDHMINSMRDFMQAPRRTLGMAAAHL